MGTITLRLTPVGVPQVPEIGVCDEDNDNEELIDLTDFDNEIIGSQADLNLTYHFSLGDAESNSNPQTELNAIPGSSVFIRITIGNEELCEWRVMIRVVPSLSLGIGLCGILHYVTIDNPLVLLLKSTAMDLRVGQ